MDVPHITYSELCHWYGVQKLMAGTWRDLQNRWEDLTDGEKGPLMKINGNDRIYIFGKDTAQVVFEETLVRTSEGRKQQ